MSDLKAKKELSLEEYWELDRHLGFERMLEWMDGDRPSLVKRLESGEEILFSVYGNLTQVACAEDESVIIGRENWQLLGEKEHWQVFAGLLIPLCVEEDPEYVAAHLEELLQNGKTIHYVHDDKRLHKSYTGGRRWEIHRADDGEYFIDMEEYWESDPDPEPELVVRDQFHSLELWRVVAHLCEFMEPHSYRVPGEDPSVD